MRYVDMALLELPHGWETRAEKALDELRDEIAKAEADAISAGANAQEVAEARKNAIANGLHLRRRQQIWRDLANSLGNLRKGKCWYSESRNPGSDKDVDHFRPKQRVEGVDGHEGYWWLAFDWRNYRYSSQWCNERRNDKVNNTSGGKWDEFPLAPGSFRASKEGESYEEEQVELLDPTDPDDWKLLTFRPDGQPIPTQPKGTAEYRRAEVSIRVYHLHCKELVDDRRPLAGTVQRLVESMEILLPEIGTNRQVRAVYKKIQADLMRLIHPDSDYSAAALAYVRAQIYKSQKGSQVKREWLADIVSSVPLW